MRREIVAERVIGRGGIPDDVGLDDPLPVDVHLLVDNLDAVAGNSDHALHVMRVILKRKFEDDNVPAADFAVRKNMVVPVSAPAENKFVDEQVVADQKRRLHGLRRNLERLHDKRRAKQRQDHRNQKRFDVLSHRRRDEIPRGARRQQLRALPRLLRFQMSLRSSVILGSQLYQGRDRIGLLRFFFGSAGPHRRRLAGDSDFDLKRFLMIRAGLRDHMIGAGAIPRDCRNSCSADLWSVWPRRSASTAIAPSTRERLTNPRAASSPPSR